MRDFTGKLSNSIAGGVLLCELRELQARFPG
jgi:hypothetical protein